MLLEPALDEFYHNELGIKYEISHWKITKAFNSLFKWLIEKIDVFSISGIKFEALVTLYNAIKVKTN